MKKELIMESDVLDIIFENKNKEYGAYDLRKFYNTRLLKSMALIFSSVLILCAFTFIPRKKSVAPKEELTTVFAQITQVKKEEPKVKKEPPKIKEAMPKPIPVVQTRTQTWTKPVIVNANTPTTALSNLDSVAIGNNNNIIPNDGSSNIIATPANNTGTGLKEPEKTGPEAGITTPRDFAEINPSYPGGMNALKKFLQRNLNNPRDLEEGEIITVKIKFVVGFDGKLQSFETIEDGGHIFNNEVIRVLKKMPEWIPGKTKGQNVSVYYTIPVKFVIAE